MWAYGSLAKLGSAIVKQWLLSMRVGVGVVIDHHGMPVPITLHKPRNPQLSTFSPVCRIDGAS